jgi:hypothetical protein
MPIPLAHPWPSGDTLSQARSVPPKHRERALLVHRELPPRSPQSSAMRSLGL